MQFGQILRRLRSEKGKTMGQLARELGISVTFLSDVELGRRPPFPADRIDEVVRALSLSPSEATELVAASHERRGLRLSAPSTAAAAEFSAALQRGWETFDDDTFRKLSELLLLRKDGGGK